MVWRRRWLLECRRWWYPTTTLTPALPGRPRCDSGTWRTSSRSSLDCPRLTEPQSEPNNGPQFSEVKPSLSYQEKLRITDLILRLALILFFKCLILWLTIFFFPKIGLKLLVELCTRIVRLVKIIIKFFRFKHRNCVFLQVLLLLHLLWTTFWHL